MCLEIASGNTCLLMTRVFTVVTHKLSCIILQNQTFDSQIVMEFLKTRHNSARTEIIYFLLYMKATL